jgi:hypothetical protein
MAPSTAPASDLVPVTVRIRFGEATIAKDDAPHHKLQITLKRDGSESLREVKEKVAAAAGGSVTADDLMLVFGPVDRKLGRQYRGDPTVDDTKLTLAQFSVLDWLERFPHWSLGARLLPPAPPPPGVAIKRAAAVAEGKDPERAVTEGRAKGDIPRINDLPAPWGPKPYDPPPTEDLIRDGYLPATYPANSSPLVTS